MTDPAFAPATADYQAIVDHALTTTRGVRQRLDFDRAVDDQVILDCINVAEQAPNADAYLANGMCNFRRESDGLAQRFCSLEVGLEAALGKPVITHDNALYWRIFKTLGLAPATPQGRLLSSL